MKFTYFLFVSITLCFLMSCDGRERPHKSNKTVLKENKLLDSFSENTTYKPAKEAIIATDTILKNGYTVKIKNWTDPINAVSSSYKEGHIKYITKHRQFIADIEIKKDEKSIFKSALNKNKLLKNSALLKINTEEPSNIRFAGAFVDQEKSIDDDLVISLHLEDPILETLYIYHLIVSHNGNETIKFDQELKYVA